MKKVSTIFLATLCLSISLLGCGQQTTNNQGVYMLVDTSGTYRNEIDKAAQIVYFTLARLEPSDSFVLARIDTGSFSEKDIIAKTTFDDRPSTANGQKRIFADQVEKFTESEKSSPYTDITGGLLQAIEFLNEKDSGRKTIFIFSDLKQDLEEGYVRDNIPMRLDGFDVVALNVTKLRSDNVDPREYMTRLNDWKTQVTENGGTWRVVNDLDDLDGLFKS
ncbi:MAG: VWA domain-containing protein [Gammaproteobacteria bacterium]